ncbi:M28 family peptidase [Flavobacterium caeni]|nr:M28 family peptidase [Flavobacterium caeni]
MKKFLLLMLMFPLLSTAQTDHESTFRKIYDSALTQSKCYAWLDDLSNKIGARLSGSENAEKAVLYTKTQMEQSGCFDKVWLQEVMVPKWVRGEKETAFIRDGKKKTAVPICALGSSVATPKVGLEAEVVEVHSIAELETLGTQRLKGKIVFFNRPMDPKHVDTFTSYGGCVDQRGKGAREAAKFGAVGVIVRSMTLRLDDYPHAGNMGYGDLPRDQYIPAAAISTNGAELLSKTLKANPKLRFFFKQSCETFPDVLSYNVIGEITGSTHPQNIMVVGGHLDSWDIGDGSHDDGAGVVQSMEVAHIFKNIGYQPQNTLRVVLFMNEENGGRGGDQYQAEAARKKEHHIFALESDCGGFSPRGFTFDGSAAQLEWAKQTQSLFEPYLVHVFKKGYAGVDIAPLKSPNLLKAGFRPDTQRYFDHHHAATDTFAAVNKRELELGAATMAALVYLVDQQGQ